MLHGCEAQEQLVVKSGTVAFVQYVLHWLLKSLYKVDQVGPSVFNFALSDNNSVIFKSRFQSAQCVLVCLRIAPALDILDDPCVRNVWPPHIKKIQYKKIKDSKILNLLNLTGKLCANVWHL